jgi:Tol biopolymer transport system component
MTNPISFELDDAQIERMLAKRAGSEAPIAMVQAVMATVGTTKQQRGGWLPRLQAPSASGNRSFILVAGAALISLSIVAGLIGSGLVRPPTDLVQVPPVATTITTPSPVPTPSPASTPNPTPSAVPSPSPTPVTVVNGPLIVYHIGTKGIELFTLDPVGGKRVTLGNLQNRTGPAGQSIHWSADHRYAIAFGSSDSVVARIDVGGRSVTPLRLPANGSRDSVSPNGDLVARLEDEGSRTYVSVVDLEGTEVHHSAPLPEGVTPVSAIVWSPDASSLLVSSCFPCEVTPPRTHLFQVPVDGSPVQDLVETTSSEYFGSMRWSPDRSTIVYTNGISCDTCSGGVATLRVADRVLTQLTTNGGEEPAWSPDGRRIVFARGFEAPDSGIYVMDADGSNLIRLTTAATGVTDGDRDPIWSPDGASIVFSRGPYDSSMGDLYIVPAAGGEPRLLVKNAVADW